MIIPTNNTDTEYASGFADGYKIGKEKYKPRNGKWKYIGYMVMECSECNAQLHGLECAKFCPNCGAKMEGEADG